MNVKILKLIESDGRMPIAELAVACGITEDEARAELAAMEREGIIRGYKAIIDWERVDTATVSAIIELKVVPKAGFGFEDVAEQIANYPEVESVSLMSGSCDLTVTVKGRTFQEVSSFVAKELAFIEGVTSTATQFVMKKYKELGVDLTSTEDGRSKVSL